MPRPRSLHVCRECGYQSPGWLGRCPACGQWNTIVEEAVPSRPSGIPERPPGPAPAPLRLNEVDSDRRRRIGTGLGELDRVLGGGLVAGSTVVVGGEPGIGKSTLLLQALLAMGAEGVPVLLVTGEESPAQVKLRSTRLGGDPGGLLLLAETQTESVVACLEEQKPAVCVVDSVQTLWSAEVGSPPGSVAQIRDATGRLLQVAKGRGVALLLVGHVTKDGDLAGPRVLEHMVDAVLSFEGERGQPYRILRAVKNRFGSTNEIGVFEMGDRGLVEVCDPSAVFVEQGEGRSGSAVAAVIEGTRCLLAEVQALAVPSVTVVPQRVARGVDRNRLAMIVAVLTRKGRIPLRKSDIFVNVGGGLSLEDPAADLAVALAIASATRDRPLAEGTAALGEVSLTGRVRYVGQVEKRLAELARHGFQLVLLPVRNVEELSSRGTPAGLKIEPVEDLSDVVRGQLG